MTKTYRGKYPTRIKEMFSKAGSRWAVTNDGVLYRIRARNDLNVPLKMPNIGDDATEHPACVLRSSEQ